MSTSKGSFVLPRPLDLHYNSNLDGFMNALMHLGCNKILGPTFESTNQTQLNLMNILVAYPVVRWLCQLCQEKFATV